jgi:hypothetical protein
MMDGVGSLVGLVMLDMEFVVRRIARKEREGRREWGDGMGLLEASLLHVGGAHYCSPAPPDFLALHDALDGLQPVIWSLDQR